LLHVEKLCTEKDEQLQALDKEGGTRVFVTEALYQALDADKKKISKVSALYQALDADTKTNLKS
jgi:hypothetical protein